jgi:hypothetical protein
MDASAGMEHGDARMFVQAQCTTVRVCVCSRVRACVGARTRRSPSAERACVRALGGRVCRCSRSSLPPQTT